MRLSKLISSAVVVSLLTIGMSAFADNHERKAFSVGTELRAQYTYNTNSILEGDTADVNDSPAPDNIFGGIAKLVFHGNIGSRTKYFLRYSLFDSIYGTHVPLGGVEAAHVSHNLGLFAVRLGANYTNMGGFEQKMRQFDAQFISAGMDGSATISVPNATGTGATSTEVRTGVNRWGLTIPSFDLMVNLADKGKVTVQLTNDVRVNNISAGNPNNDEVYLQPSLLVEWHGKFGSIQPLLQYGFTDQGKYHALSAGIAFKDRGTGLDLTLDFSKNFETISGSDDDAASWTNIAVQAGINVRQFMPFAKFAWSDYEQQPTNSETNSAVPLFDDNKIEWVVGSYMRMDGNAFKPYLAIHGEHGNFPDGTDEESKSNLDVRLGVMSKF